MKYTIEDAFDDVGSAQQSFHVELATDIVWAGSTECGTM
jgi:hypothetical protein